MAKDLIDDIIKDLKDYSSNVAKFSAIEVRDELAKTAHDAIEAFYQDAKFNNGSSEPMWYSRNYYNFRNKSYKKYYHDSHGTVFSGGIELTPKNMDELYIHPTKSRDAKYATYGAPVELVFEKVMEEGWHGPIGGDYNNNHTEPMSPSPMELIDKTYKRLCRSTSIVSNAEKKARKLSKYL